MHHLSLRLPPPFLDSDPPTSLILRIYKSSRRSRRKAFTSEQVLARVFSPNKIIVGRRLTIYWLSAGYLLAVC